MKPNDGCLWERYALVKDCPLVRLIGRFERHEGLGFFVWDAEDLETGEKFNAIEEDHLIPLNEMEVLAWIVKRAEKSQ